MINLKWTLVETHRRIVAGVSTPAHIKYAALGTMYGIPYCYGGYNGLENFKNAIIAPNALAGNVNHEGGRQDYTVGLDCSGFVSSAFKQSTHLSSFDYRTIGCLATSFDQLQAGDILVTKSAGEDRHVMLYAGKFKVVNNGQAITVDIYDCTGAENVYEQRANKRTITVKSFFDKYYLRIALAQMRMNTKGHWRGCSLCPAPALVAPHTYNANKVCTVCGYYNSGASPWPLYQQTID